MASRLTIFLVLLSSIFGVLFAQHYDRDLERVRYKAERKYIHYYDRDEICRFDGSTTVSRNEVIRGPVVVSRGNLHVRGKIHGDVLVLYGDVVIHDKGKIRGDVTTINGNIRLRRYGYVSGKMLETHERNLRRTRRYVRNYSSYRYSYRPVNYGTLRMPKTDHNIALRYNRVEGVFLGLEVPRTLHRHASQFDLYGFAGYGFDSEEFRYQIGLQRWLFDPVDFRTEIGFEYHDLTDTKDLWRIDYLENSLSAFFLNRDYHDYYQRQGYSFRLSQNFSRFFQISGEYRRDDYFSMPLVTEWSLFRRDASFRSNPQLGQYEGNMRSIYAQLLVDTRNDIHYPRKGLYFRVSGETSHPGLRSDFDFERYVTEARFYQPISNGERLMLRLIAGTARGDLPLQKNFEIGGLSTLRAYPFKAFAGNRIFLANVEYLLSPDIFDNFLGIDGLDFIVFGDLGDAWSGNNNESIIDSFQPWRWDRLKTDVGLGIADSDGHFRLNIAKRTDRSDNDVVITFRLRQPF